MTFLVRTNGGHAVYVHSDSAANAKAHVEQLKVHKGKAYPNGLGRVISTESVEWPLKADA